MSPALPLVRLRDQVLSAPRGGAEGGRVDQSPGSFLMRVLPGHRRLARGAVSALVGFLTVVAVASTAAATPPSVRAFGSAIDGYMPYQGQSKCDPNAKPGVLAFDRQLLANYTNTRTLGITRACSIGGQSEHKEGRAWDWGVRVANPTEYAQA